jgi:hypothetical protein
MSSTTQIPPFTWYSSNLYLKVTTDQIKSGKIPVLTTIVTLVIHVSATITIASINRTPWSVAES